VSSEKLAGRITSIRPDIDVLIIPDAGHALSVDQPIAVARHLRHHHAHLVGDITSTDNS
jgi:pimeloyl-ACP methyl ester carboxylesterase